MVATGFKQSGPGLLGNTSNDLMLRVRGSEHDGRLIRLNANKCVIGSAEGCTLRLRGRGLEAIYGVIFRGEQGIGIRRWSRAMRLNGAGFDAARLSVGDVLTLGPVEFEVLAPPARPTNQAGTESTGTESTGTESTGTESADEATADETGEEPDVEAAEYSGPIRPWQGAPISQAKPGQTAPLTSEEFLGLRQTLELERQVRQLQEQLSARETSEETTADGSEGQSLESELASLRLELIESKSDLKLARERAEEMQLELGAAAARGDELQIQMSTWEQDQNRIGDQNLKQDEQVLEREHAARLELQRQLDEVRAARDALQQQLETQAAETEQMHRQLLEREQRQARLDEQSKEQADSQDALQQQLAASAEARDDLARQLEAQRLETDSLRQELEVQRVEREEFRATTEQFEAELASLKSDQSRVLEVQAACDKAAEICEDLQQRLVRSDAENSQLQQQLDQQRQRAEVAEVGRNEAEQALTRVAANEPQESRVEKEELQARLAQSTNEQEAVVRERDKLRAMAEQMRAQLDELAGERDQFSDQVAQWEQQRSEIHEQMSVEAARLQSEGTRLQQLESALDDVRLEMEDSARRQAVERAQELGRIQQVEEEPRPLGPAGPTGPGEEPIAGDDCTMQLQELQIAGPGYEVPLPKPEPEPEDHDSYVQNYMDRLLNRVRGDAFSQDSASQPSAAEPSRGPVVEAPLPAAPQASPVPETAANDVGQWSTHPVTGAKMLPRLHAAELPQNLSAMREIANLTARGAIDLSTKRRWGSDALAKMFIALACYTVTLALVYFGTASYLWYAGMVSMIVGLLFTVRSLLVAKNFVLSHKKDFSVIGSGPGEQSIAHPKAAANATTAGPVTAELSSDVRSNSQMLELIESQVAAEISTGPSESSTS